MRPPVPPVKRSRTGLVFGAHLGVEATAGSVPLPADFPGNTSVALGSVSGPGFAYGGDVGFRFARHWLVGVTLEHAAFAAGSNVSNLAGDAANVSSETTLLGLNLGLIANPDKSSFYGEIGVGNRWYKFSFDSGSNRNTLSYSSGEFLLGLGLWIPIGHSVRLLPEITCSLGTFGPPGGGSSTGSEAHGFVMIGLKGFYNLDF